jgi:hypothetical protein
MNPPISSRFVGWRVSSPGVRLRASLKDLLLRRGTTGMFPSLTSISSGENVPFTAQLIGDPRAHAGLRQPMSTTPNMHCFEDGRHYQGALTPCSALRPTAPARRGPVRDCPCGAPRSRSGTAVTLRPDRPGIWRPSRPGLFQDQVPAAPRDAYGDGTRWRARSVASWAAAVPPP